LSAEKPISPKAVASTGGAGLGAVLATFVTWLLGVAVWNASSAAAKADDAVAAVPTPIAAVIALVIPAALAAILSWSVTDPLRVTTQQLRTLRDLNRDAD
jgi:uncharacterized membrane protein